MAQVDTRTRTTQGETGPLKPPRVLVVLVTHNGAAWLPQCLAALSRQTHPRIAIIGITTPGMQFWFLEGALHGALNGRPRIE